MGEGRRDETLQLLYRDDVVSVLDLDCRAEAASGHDLVLSRSAMFFVRDGMFEVESDDDRGAGQPNHVMCLNAATPYHVHHPLLGGDHCTIIQVAADDDGFDMLRRRCSSTAALAHIRFFTMLAHANCDALEVQEHALAIVDMIRGNSPTRATPRPSWTKLARDAEVLVAERFRDPLTLADIADTLGVSPSHLSRVFATVVGTALHRYRTDLRLRAALVALSKGPNDLSALAYELGFADAAHFTNSFKSVFGIPPSTFRAAAA